MEKKLEYNKSILTESMRPVIEEGTLPYVTFVIFEFAETTSIFIGIQLTFVLASLLIEFNFYVSIFELITFCNELNLWKQIAVYMVRVEFIIVFVLVFAFEHELLLHLYVLFFAFFSFKVAY